VQRSLAIVLSLLGVLAGCPSDPAPQPGPASDAATPDAVADAATSDATSADSVQADSSAQPDGTADPDATVAPEVPLPTGPVYSTFIGDWDMPSGQEVTKCVVKKLDNTEPINVAAIRTTLSAGSHHLIVYKVSDRPEKPDPFNCSPFIDTLSGGSAPLMISQVGVETLQFPPGVVAQLEPNQTIRIEAHYLNYYPDTITAHADIEFLTTEDTDVEKADFLFYGTPAFVLPPNEEVSTDWVWMDVPNGAKVFAITGHTHQHGTNVEVTKSTGLFGDPTTLYPADEPFVWDEAPVVYHQPPIEFGPGEGFRFRCTWNNTSSEYVAFGESANQEMCFLWAYYYPSQGFRLCAPPLLDCPSDN